VSNLTVIFQNRIVQLGHPVSRNLIFITHEKVVAGVRVVVRHGRGGGRRRVVELEIFYFLLKKKKLPPLYPDGIRVL
jgi:hypothetical protein